MRCVVCGADLRTVRIMVHGDANEWQCGPCYEHTKHLADAVKAGFGPYPGVQKPNEEPTQPITVTK